MQDTKTQKARHKKHQTQDKKSLNAKRKTQKTPNARQKIA